MKSNSIGAVLRIIIALMAVSSLFTACGTKKTSPGTSAVNSNSNPLSIYGNISASVFGLANFEGYAQTFDYPIKFEMPAISISWMGNIFNGLLNGAGSGADTTYQVHGSVSSDGAWIESMIYSMEVEANAGLASFYRVTLKNVPLTKSLDSAGNPLDVCAKDSADVQRFVSKIEYLNTGGFTYIGTNLADPSCVATLGVTLALGPGIAASDGTPGGLLGQGMM